MTPEELKRLRKKCPIQPHILSVRRNEQNVSQAEVVEALREYMFSEEWGDKKKPTLNNSSVSAWETGKRAVPAKYIKPLCDILDATEGYLRGFTDNPHEETLMPIISETSKDVILKKTMVAREKLYLYDKQPLYIVSKSLSLPSGWGIFDSARNRIVLYNQILSLNNWTNLDDLEFYAAIPYFADNTPLSTKQKYPLSPSDIFERDRMYISMKTPDEALRNEYNGWYRHNENRSGLINEANGLVLPYSGIDVSFFAYKDVIP